MVACPIATQAVANRDKTQRSFRVTKPKTDSLDEAAIAAMIAQPAASLDEVETLLLPLLHYFAPQFHQIDQVPQDKPTMFVANHSLWSVADLILPYGIRKHLGHNVRPLGDRMHFAKLAPQRSLFEKMGVVVGDRAVVRALMADGQSMLVFPGGSREVMKRHDEKYALQWKKRVGFVRMALEGGYTITPVGVSGGDDIFDILFDSGDFLRTPLGRMISANPLARKLLKGGEELPQLVRGLGFSAIPRPQQFHYVFGAPISLEAYQDRIEDEDALLEARGTIAETLLALVETAHVKRREGMSAASWLRQIAAGL